MTESDGPRLLAPVGPSSVIAPVASVRYTEIDGRAVLCDTTTRDIHALSPAAAVIWGLLDGRRTVAEIALVLVSDTSSPDLVDTVELVRRFRVIGLAEDAVDDADHTTSPLRERVDARDLVVHLHGSVVSETVAQPKREPSRTMRLAPVADPTSPLVAVALRAEEATADGDRLDGLVIAASSGQPTGPLTPYEVFEALVGSVAGADLEIEGVLDLLADLAEAVPGRQAQAPAS